MRELRVSRFAAPTQQSGSVSRGQKNLIVAVTGGIGSGKSTLSSLFAEAGALVVSADLLAREAVQPGSTGLEKIVAAVGAEVITDAGELDRKALADIIFSNPDKRSEVEQIIHPIVQQLASEAFTGADPGRICVYDLPLITSAADAAPFDVVIVVEADKDVRLRRLEERGVERPDAERRIAAQISDEERRAWADIVVENNGSVEDLKDFFTDELWPLVTLWSRQRRQGENLSGNV